MTPKKREIIMAHIDYENIRWRFRDYTEYVTLEDVMKAFQSIADEIGELRQVFYYGDWTRRPADAHAIENRGHRAVNVLCKKHGGDRSDPTMMFAVDDQSREKKVKSFLLGAGDADYKEVILRCRERGNKIYIACFGLSASRELFTMTEKVYPLETHLKLTKKAKGMLPTQADDSDAKVSQAIRTLDRIQKTLPVVVRNYFRSTILLPIKIFGETNEDVDEFIDQMIQDGLFLSNMEDNPKIPGRKLSCLTLNRDNQTIINELSNRQ